jgi:hypothetical protein
VSADTASGARKARVMSLIGAGHGLRHFCTLVLPFWLEWRRDRKRAAAA